MQASRFSPACCAGLPPLGRALLAKRSRMHVMAARSDERIRYVRLPDWSAVGAKCNLGCQFAAGEFVAQWDDDWMGYSRLSAQVSGLAAAGADVHACRELLHYRVDAGDAWLLRPHWPDTSELGDADLRLALAAGAREYCNDRSWDRVAQRHLALWTALEVT